MIQNLFGQMSSSQRDLLRNAGLGASIAVLPAAVTGGTVLGKDEAMHDSLASAAAPVSDVCPTEG